MGAFQNRLKVLEMQALNEKRINLLFDYFVERAQEYCGDGGVEDFACQVTEDDYYHHVCEFEFLGKEWTRKYIGIEIKRENSDTFSFKLAKGDKDE